jgi:DNA-binding MarR family transcriptional regulator
VTNYPDILFMLHDVARQLRLESDRRARAHDMTRAQWVILVCLERQPGLSQKALAEILEVEPITVARLIDRLEDRGMVERRGDPTDRRVWRLHLLPPAIPVLRDIHTEREDLRSLLVDGVDARTLATINAGLVRMKANLMAEPRGRALERPALEQDVA